MEIGKRLRHRRTELNLSRVELANKIHVTPSAIANYENGISYPKPTILVALMNALDIDANYLYWNYLSNHRIQQFYGTPLSSEEKDAIFKYRELSDYGKRLVHLIIDEEYQRMKKSEDVQLPLYRPGVRKAHSGFLFQNSSQTIRVSRNHVPEYTNFCFHILSDRYQPVYQKNDLLALQHTCVSHNEIGLFWFDGIYYLRALFKEGDHCRLRSLNVIDPDIIVTDPENLECIGKVLGKVYGSYEIIRNTQTDITDNELDIEIQ